MLDRTYLWSAMGLIVVAVGLGFYAIGGPNQAREDRFDAKKYSQMLSIGTAMMCSEKKKFVGGDLPVTLTQQTFKSYCPGRNFDQSKMKDPETGKSFVYTRVSANEYTLCSDFHNADRMIKRKRQPVWRLKFEADTGCMRGILGAKQ